MNFKSPTKLSKALSKPSQAAQATTLLKKPQTYKRNKSKENAHKCVCYLFPLPLCFKG